MDSRDPACKAAASLLEPAQRELAERRKGLTNRHTKTFDLRRSTPLPAAAVALLAMDLVTDKSQALVVVGGAAAAGWIFRRALSEGPTS